MRHSKHQRPGVHPASLLLLPFVLVGQAQCEPSQDSDGDGAPDAVDCSPRDATVYPGAVEVCNDRDDDCDGFTDEDLPEYTFYADDDHDDYGDPGGASVTACRATQGFGHHSGDCDDTAWEINPGQAERCGNLVDEDCSGAIDDGLTDSDGDGVKDGCDLCPGFDDGVDADGDGHPDGCQANLRPVFPNGDYVLYDPFAYYTGGGPGEVVTWYAFVSGDAMTGRYSGTVVEVFWEDEYDYSHDEPPLCAIYNSVEAYTYLPSAGSPSPDPDDCPGCAPLSEWDVLQVDSSACPAKGVEAWIETDDPWVWELGYVWNAGYRHAATDGWPSEWSSWVYAAEELGYVGTIYGFASSGASAPVFLVAPDVHARRGAEPWDPRISPTLGAPRLLPRP